MKKLTVVFVLLFQAWVGSVAYAQENPSTSKLGISLEIDPATFVFKGYSAHVRIKPPTSKHVLIGAGVYALDMPSMLVDLNPENKAKDWNVRLKLGYGVFGEYHFREVNKRLFVGSQLSFQTYQIEKENEPNKSEFTNILFMPYAGYTIQPFNFPLYAKFWGGVGYTNKISGSNELNGKTYDIAPITMFATVHVGYTIK